MELLISLFLIFICNIIDPAKAQDQFWHDGQFCSVSSGNYTQNSDYRKNLDNVLYKLTDTNNGLGFYNSTSGEANAAALCRGDQEPESCRRCVDDATRRIRQDCPVQKMAAGWYDTCLIRYSNQSMGIADVVLSGYMNVSISTVSQWNQTVVSQWNQTVVDLLSELRPKAAGGGPLRKYASGNKTAPSIYGMTVYGMMQCTPDLSESDCLDCLGLLVGVIPYLSRRLGARVLRSSCVLRFQNYSFFGPTWFPPPPPPPSPSPPLPPSSFPPPPPSPSLTSSGNKNIGVIVGPVLAAVMVMIFVVVFITFRRRRKRNGTGPLLPKLQVEFSEGSQEDDHEDTGEMNLFDLSTIHVATDNFSSENKLGQGGFGPVYKGKLQDGKEIAVKRLSENSGQGVVEFKTEVKLIIKLQHRNLVRLLGYCVKGSERILIYEFMANNSLDTFLFDANKCKELDWPKRSNIVIGIAKGLRYLHEDSRLKIIHRDMKASNILLDDEMNAKISDFGTARIFGGKQMEAATNRIVGTYGYMAPEYAMEGLFSAKSDVYSFGVLLLEIISGQRNNHFYYQDQHQNLLLTAWRLWNENKGEQLIDQCQIQTFPTDEALRWINIALLCVQEDPQERPTMSTVVTMLEGQLSTNLRAPSEPPVSFARSAAISEQTKSSTSDLSAHPSITISTTIPR